MSSHPLNFCPPRVYVLKDVWENPQAARRAERVAAACPGVDLRTFTYADLPDIVVDEGWDRSPRMGCLPEVPPPVPILGLFRFDEEAVSRDAARMQDAYTGTGSFPFRLAAGGGAFTFFCSGQSEMRPNPEHVCRPQWRLHQGRGCPHQCGYCGLGAFLVSHVNTEEYIERLSDLLRQNPWQKTWLYDDVMDVLTLEPQLDSLAPLMRFFESTGDRYLILHTKSDRVDSLIEAEAPANTIIAWSLSGPTQSREVEPLTGTTESRIEAARRCQEAGITIRYKFKPIVPVPNWRDEATYTVDLALATTRPDNLSLTFLMWMDVDALKKCIPEHLLDPEFLQAAEAAIDQMRGIHVGPFPDELRERVYRHYLAAIRARDTEIPVTICTESLDMWAEMGEDLGFTPGNYVCGCGAGATPNLRALSTSPWQDAQAAVKWDGSPVVL
jgi:spore photoproduct lyase